MAGGGAWKVAYADFVTALFALFLVLWIMGQDEEIQGIQSRDFNAGKQSPKNQPGLFG